MDGPTTDAGGLGVSGAWESPGRVGLLAAGLPREEARAGDRSEVISIHIMTFKKCKNNGSLDRTLAHKVSGSLGRGSPPTTLPSTPDITALTTSTLSTAWAQSCFSPSTLLCGPRERCYPGVLPFSRGTSVTSHCYIWEGQGRGAITMSSVMTPRPKNNLGIQCRPVPPSLPLPLGPLPPEGFVESDAWRSLGVTSEEPKPFLEWKGQKSGKGLQPPGEAALPVAAHTEHPPRTARTALASGTRV